jgi:DNA polymerase delta subunit 4
MPTTKRSTASNRGRTVPIKGQSTISFANRITKNVVNDAKKAIISPPVAKIETPEKSDVTEKPAEDVSAVEPEPEAEVEEEPEIEVPEKSEVELKAEKITKKQIETYWKGIEAKRIAPRVHQKDLSTNEKVLRYFDVSSQYGVRNDNGSSVEILKLTYI